MKPIGIGIIGFGKIAADQHVPAIAANPRLQLLGTSSRSVAGPAPCFTDWRELVGKTAGLEAVAITTPPGPRMEIAAECAAAGLHVLMEKPPTATLSEAEALVGLKSDVTMFASWHARQNPAVPAAADLLAGKRIASMRIIWHEDVRKWHPGQDWIWDPGGFGVFDPGINAFSIATKIFPGSLFVREAELSFPENSETPIAADIEFASNVAEGPLRCSLDWRRTEGEEWTIAIRTSEGTELRLEGGGSRLLLDGAEQTIEDAGEYPDLYRHFVNLIDERRSHVDVAPLRLVADCLLVGRRRIAEPVRA